jgi:hypothetical protein
VLCHAVLCCPLPVVVLQSIQHMECRALCLLGASYAFTCFLSSVSSASTAAPEPLNHRCQGVIRRLELTTLSSFLCWCCAYCCRAGTLRCSSTYLEQQ